MQTLDALALEIYHRPENAELTEAGFVILHCSYGLTFRHLTSAHDLALDRCESLSEILDGTEYVFEDESTLVISKSGNARIN